MTPTHWEVFKKAAQLKKTAQVPMALIIDSPWIPGHMKISHMEYYLNPEAWFHSNLHIQNEFADIIFVPSWWMEFGMAAEPSALGAKIRFWTENTPSEVENLYNMADIEKIMQYDVKTDGFMALTLQRMRMHKQRIYDLGHILPLVAARGPLCTAGFVRGTTNLMMDLLVDPQGAHQLIDLCTNLAIDWLRAQADIVRESVEGILLLDDIVGFLGTEDYKTFAHPYLKKICDAFPNDWVKIYHNDANVDACLQHLPETGFNVLNWGKQTDIKTVKEKIGGQMCLMGNVNPLEIGVQGSPEQVFSATMDVLRQSEGEGIILSLGGGVSPGMPAENIHAMKNALDQFNAQ
jgi:uroporphyrinogen-III decarboxylase